MESYDYIKDLNSEDQEYMNNICNRKSIPLLLFNDHIFEGKTGNVRQLYNGEGLVNPSSGKIDKSYNKRDQIYLVKEAVLVLRQLYLQHKDESIGVVTVSGPMRTGKSFVSGLVVNDKTFSTFELGHEMKSFTKGVWMACQLLVIEGKKILVLDTEGLDSTSCSNVHDDILFAVVFLLSSYLIFNTVGFPKREDIHKLQFIQNIVRKVSIDNTDNISNTVEKIKFYSPDFMWIFRDVLKSVPSPYHTMEEFMIHDIFGYEEDMYDAEAKKRNDIKRSIMSFFKSMTFETLEMPTTNPSSMVNMAELFNNGKLNQNFIYGITSLVNDKIIPNIPLKVMPHYSNPNAYQNMNLDSFIQFTYYIINCISSEFSKLPSYEDAYNLIVNNAIAKAEHVAKETYINCMRQQLFNATEPLDLEKINEIHAYCSNVASDIYYKEQGFNSSEQTNPNKLLDCLNQEKETFIVEQGNLSVNYNTQLIQQLYKEIVLPTFVSMKERKIQTVSSIDEALSSFRENYFQNSRGIKVVEVYDSFNSTVIARDLDELSKIKELTQHINSLKEQNNKDLEKVKQEQVRLSQIQNDKQFLQDKLVLMGKQMEQNRIFMDKMIKEQQKSSEVMFKQQQRLWESSFKEQAKMAEQQQQNVDRNNQLLLQAMSKMQEDSKQQYQMLFSSLQETVKVAQHVAANRKPSVWQTLLTCGAQAALTFISPTLGTIPVVGKFLQATTNSFNSRYFGTPMPSVNNNNTNVGNDNNQMNTSSHQRERLTQENQQRNNKL
ncbi:hypothetical protein ABK040_016872 [Willaertia magna]